MVGACFVKGRVFHLKDAWPLMLMAPASSLFNSCQAFSRAAQSQLPTELNRESHLQKANGELCLLDLRIWPEIR